MKPIDLDGLKTYELAARPSKVFVEDLGQPLPADAAVRDWVDALPRQLGGHVIKTGCGPYLIDWIQRGVIRAVAMNGSAAIHDFELAFAGKTSEDVGAALGAGQ